MADGTDKLNLKTRKIRIAVTQFESVVEPDSLTCRYRYLGGARNRVLYQLHLFV
jgi:hypothetical protein